MKKTTVLTMALACTFLAHCSSGTHRKEVLDRVVDSAPYESTDPKAWDRYFHAKKSRMTPETMSRILNGALEGIYDPDAISDRLTSMGMYNYISLEGDPEGKRSFPPDPLPPNVFFICNLGHMTNLWTERDIAGHVILGDETLEDRFIVKSIYTSL